MSNATSHLVWLALWKRTCSPKVEWRTTLAQNVVSHLVNQDSWGANWSVIIHTGEKVHECSELFIWSGWTLKKCKRCDFSSITKSSLSQHLLTHSGERYYHCKECGSSFSRAGHLKRHLLTHSGEKPHKHTQCDYECSRVDALSYHIKTHSLQKPNQSQNLKNCKGTFHLRFSGIRPLRGYPPPLLTENQSEKKKVFFLSGKGGYPPPLTESPLSFSGKFFPKRAKNDVFFIK